jgi:ABC-2 type transport system ATP-binding protein
VIAEGTPDTLGRDGHTVVSFRLPVHHDGLPLPAGAKTEREHVSFTTTAPTRDLSPILTWASARGMELENLTVARPSLEDVYLQLTQES